MGNSTPQINVHHVSDIIKVLNSGIEFYRDAMEQVDREPIRGVFSDMVQTRINAVERLQPYAILEEGKREDGSSFAVQARKSYTSILGSIKSDTEHTYISQLEEVEDKTLEEIREALGKKQVDGCREALREVHDAMQRCHDRMKSLQEATA